MVFGGTGCGVLGRLWYGEFFVRHDITSSSFAAVHGFFLHKSHESIMPYVSEPMILEKI